MRWRCSPTAPSPRGDNQHGALGDGTTTSATSPVAVAGLDDVIAVGAGLGLSVAVKDDGTVWTWGFNGYGALGDGTTTDRESPAQVPGLSGIEKIAVGDYHVLALASDGTVFAWGRNASGQLGDGTTTDRWSPVAISGPGSGPRGNVERPAYFPDVAHRSAGAHRRVHLTTRTFASSPSPMRSAR